MRKKKRPLILLLISFLSFLCGGYLVMHFSPSYEIKIAQVTVSALYVFFLFVFLFTFSFAGFVFRSMLQGTIFAIFFVFFLLLRLFDFTQLLFQLLMLALFVAVELFFFAKNNN